MSKAERFLTRQLGLLAYTRDRLRAVSSHPTNDDMPSRERMLSAIDDYLGDEGYPVGCMWEQMVDIIGAEEVARLRGQEIGG